MNTSIICPHCQSVNEPLDNEDTNIEFTTIICTECEQEFSMSRKIAIEYTTWKWGR